MILSMNSKKGYIDTSIGAVLWGINGVFASFLFTRKNITSDWLAPYRLLLAGILLLGFLYVKDKNKIFAIVKNKKDLKDIIIFGIFGMMGTQYTYFTTIQHSNAGIATVLQYFGPTLILIYICLREKRKPKPYEITALLLSMFGVFILATHGNINTLQVSPTALFWGMLSAVALVVYTVQPARLLKKYGAAIVTSWGMLVGGAVLSILRKPWTQGVEVDFTIIVFLLLIVFVGTIFAFLFYLSGVNLIGPTKASLVACTEPVVATICSVIFLGVSFSFLDAVGFVFIMSTVFIVAYFGEK
ncbi:MAG: EamA family transporter [Fusobacterium sp.]|nr:EamA family transporter [Fusobacterium sp.]